MADRRFRLSPGEGARVGRRAVLAGLAALVAAPEARAFGQANAFHPRVLETGSMKWGGVRVTAPSRWAWELVRRTSAPGRLVATTVGADQKALFAEPFLIWAGDRAVEPLGQSERRGLEAFVQLGGMLVVDDSEPARGAFGKSVRRELARVLPSSAVVKLGADHVIYKSYYLLDRPVGRVVGPPYIEAIVRGRNAQILFLQHDLLGALARSPSGAWALEVEPGGVMQREHAARFAVNLAMYLLCSDYKDDQVHASWLMRRRAGRR
ncbi:MAG: DUF4159 domain-containing protein [Sorangiineae bacterium]|nr:DUF4159 domain-containing protein [Polyangiaceae bacterium]MEB2323959.1 DUF4159 domain-containing protein [Sorangiineae bacterium]